MAKTKEQKQGTLKDLKEKLLQQKAAVFIDFNSVDVAGNQETINNSNILLDTVNPTVDANFPTASVSSSTVTVTASASDATSGIAGYWYRVDGGTWIFSSSNSYAFNSQSNGNHTYDVMATDGADNNSAPASVIANVNVTSGSGSTSTGSSSSGHTYYNAVTPPVDDGHTVDDVPEEDTTDDTPTDDETDTDGDEPEEEPIGLLAGNLIISDANVQATGLTGLFGLGSLEDQASIAIPLLILLVLIVGVAVFLTQTATGQNIVKGSKK